MGTRLEFDTVLRGLCQNVYFQPPATKRIDYPCIVYNRHNIDQQFADDRPYIHTKRYSVTVISKNPDSDIVDKVAELPQAIYDRFYFADNLNHDVFNIYF